ncbi:hypothetical protein BJX68DRAFT_270449 [Aspergillus pseudodeflectus]|uniref:Uncharacterized protein n=1 Tax=Aspergillus pseudodeflectus TaxID=176178 RepID=A0ABR4JSK9_9EURO
MEKERDVENIEKVGNAGPVATTERRPGKSASSELQGIDKFNIGNAATSDTFVSDTIIRETDVSNSVSLFAATYVPFRPVCVTLDPHPSPLLGRRDDGAVRHG